MYFLLKVDVQHCNITLGSWGYHDDKLIFQWSFEENMIAGGLNGSLNQHYFTVDYPSAANDTGYSGISDGR